MANFAGAADNGDGPVLLCMKEHQENAWILGYGGTTWVTVFMWRVCNPSRAPSAWVFKRAAVETWQWWRKHVIKVSPTHLGHDTAESYGQFIATFEKHPLSLILTSYTMLMCMYFLYFFRKNKSSGCSTTCINPMYTRLVVVSRTITFASLRMPLKYQSVKKKSYQWIFFFISVHSILERIIKLQYNCWLRRCRGHWWSTKIIEWLRIFEKIEFIPGHAYWDLEEPFDYLKKLVE